MTNRFNQERSKDRPREFRMYGNPGVAMLASALLASALLACHEHKSEGTTPKPAATRIETESPQTSPKADSRQGTTDQTHQPGTSAGRPSPGGTQGQTSARTGHPGARNSTEAHSVTQPRPTGPGQAPRSAVTTAKVLTKTFSGRKITGLALGKPGLALATDDRRVHLLDAATGKELWVTEAAEQTLSRLSFAAGAPKLAAVGNQLSSYVWDLDQKKLFRTWHRKSGTAQALSADGSMLVREDVRHSVRWFQLSTYKMKWLVKAKLLGLSLDGTKALCLTKHGNLELRGADRGRLVRKVRGWKGVVLAAADQDAGKVVTITATGEGQARTWDLELRCTSAKAAASAAKTRLADEPLDLVVLWPVRLAVVRTAKGLLFVDLCSHKILENRPMPVVALTSFGDQLALATKNGTVEIWKVGRTVPTCPLTCGTAR